MRVLYSEWLVISKNTARPLADAIAAHLEEGDHLLVQELGKDAAWLTLRISDASFKEWLVHARDCTDD